MAKILMEIATKLKKPVEAIQCTNTFSLLQRKMYNVLLANAAGSLHASVTHRIGMKHLCSLMGYRSNDYKTIKEKFRELRRMDIEWDIINENNNKVWTNTSPLSLARVIEGEGICEYEFTPSLLPHLDRPAQYAKFSLNVQSKFKSNYGLALYENCERYRNIGYTRAFDVQTFRRLMGVGDSEYLDFFALKRRVINIAIKEVNKCADFDIAPEYEKEGRTIVRLRFLIANKQTLIPDLQPVVLNNAESKEALKVQGSEYFGLKQTELARYIKKYGKEYVDEKVNAILNSDSYKHGLIKNMAGYLKTALAENYQLNVSSKELLAQQKTDVDLLSKVEEMENGKLQDLKIEQKNYLSKATAKLVLTLTEKERFQIFEEFTKYLGNGGFLKAFHRNGLDDPIIADRFFEFAMRRHPELIDKITSFEDYEKYDNQDKRI